MRKFALLTAALVMAIAAGNAARADESPIRTLQASRIQVARACVDYQGIGLQSPAHSGQYGCYTRGGWIQCEQDGRCTGARYDHYDEDYASYARVPGIEGVLAKSHTTRLQPRNDR